MKISGIRSSIVALPADEPLADAAENPNATRPIVTLQIETDDGVVARDFPPGRSAIEGRKMKLLQLLGGPSDDPLALFGDGPDRLGTILAGISSNIGRRRRVITFGAFRRYSGAPRSDRTIRSTETSRSTTN
jgi:hypothetical protein